MAELRADNPAHDPTPAADDPSRPGSTPARPGSPNDPATPPVPGHAPLAPPGGPGVPPATSTAPPGAPAPPRAGAARPGPPDRAESERLELARLAQDAVRRVPGVVTLDPGPGGLIATTERGAHVDGILCAATRDGGYDVSVRVVAAPVPLHPLAEQLRRAIKEATTQARARVHRIDVHIADVADLTGIS